jgi:Fic family protein
MKRLKILTPTYYALFAHDYSYTIKIYFNKINEEDFNLLEFNTQAAVNSILLEKKSADLKKYQEFKENPDVANKKEVALIEDLVKAYEFAQKKELNAANIVKTHKILSKSILPPKQRGKFRIVDCAIKDLSSQKIYQAPSADKVEKYFNSLANDIQILFKRKMRLNLCFYYASYLHIGFHKISPFPDCNGIMARLLEKWFLASKLDQRAWLIPSENFYYAKAADYYQNLRKTGTDFASTDNENALDFSMMLTNSLEALSLQE